jgi:hypothetical protein
MYNKIKNTIAIIVFIVFTIGIGSVLFDKCNGGPDKGFEAKLDSLNQVTDSLNNVINDNNGVIEILMVKDSILADQLLHQKNKTIPIIKYVDSSKKAVDKYTDNELVQSLNKRYPTDTTTNPLPVAQPVLVSTVKDLVELDGDRQLLVIQDSIITLAESRISTKDSIIGKHINNELNYKHIILNKDNAIKGWEDQYSKLETQYQKHKFKSKFKNITSYVIIGGLTYLLLAK